MNDISDPKIANIVYNFLGNTLAQLNEIDKHNIGGSSLKALKTDPKNVFRVNSDHSVNLIPNVTTPIPAAISVPPQATAVAAPPEFVQQAVTTSVINTKDPRIGGEIDKIIIALNNIKAFFNEPIHN
jgi:hypothetical protein